MSVSVYRDGTHVHAATPYNAAFVTLARELNGRWLAADKVWRFDARDEARIRDICLELFGTDGAVSVPMVAVRVRLDEMREPSDGAMDLGGRPLCRRLARDGKVRLGDGVIVVEGGFTKSSGSVKHPGVGARKGTILEVRDFPETTARELQALMPDALEIVPNEAPAPVVPAEAVPVAVDPLTAAFEAGLARVNGEGGISVPERDEAITTIKRLMAAHGITVDDLADDWPVTTEENA
jgi:hypothetical protein